MSKDNGTGAQTAPVIQIAREVQTLCEETLAHVLDRARQSDMGERQFESFSSSVRECFNTRLAGVLGLLEAQGHLRKCGCLTELLAASARGVDEQDIEAWKGLLAARSGCRRCLGTGYVNTVNLRIVEKPAVGSGAAAPGKAKRI